MWPWILAIVILVISAKYPSIGIGIRAFFVIIALLIIAFFVKTGFVGDLLGILFSIPIDFVKAIFGLLKAMFVGG